MLALLDGTNFYVSVERSMRPSLRDRPVVVASNNDGCVVARSNEARALGIKMGQPLFEIRHLVDAAGLVVLSANFALYGDFSSRMMSLAAGLGVHYQIYSIDELFVEMSGIRGDLTARSHRMRERILQWLGLPVGIGLGPTKTLAKFANHIAKAAERRPGSYPSELAQVCNLGSMSRSQVDELLAATDLGEIWGIGPLIAAQMRNESLSTALDLCRMDPGVARRRWSVNVERTVRELQGQPCMSLEVAPPARQQIACTRSFGKTVTALSDLIEAVTDFACRAAAKLRAQDSHAGQVLVFVQTSPWRTNDRQYSRSVTVPLRRPTADSAQITQAACMGLRSIYRPGYSFARAGVMLLDLQQGPVVQAEFELDSPGPDRARLMGVMDRINERYGRGALQLASAGLGGSRRRWSMHQEALTPEYTTRWADLPTVRA